MSQNKTRKIAKKTILRLSVLICFKLFQIYVLGQMSQKHLTRKLYQVFMSDFL